MAGNKGRGRAAYTFNIEAVGFSRGDKLPDVVLKPPPLFPDTDYKPVPLKTGESEDYVLALKQELRETMKRMPYFIETPEEKQDIERYILLFCSIIIIIVITFFTFLFASFFLFIFLI
uniref:DNA-directed RNA polymerase III subunit RPC7 n=1 Tax=Microcebus murinus TaxID=30608 RepID=A0A8C5W950_MICMU